LIGTLDTFYAVNSCALSFQPSRVSWRWITFI
jgi:hypothetical protein